MSFGCCYQVTTTKVVTYNLVGTNITWNSYRLRIGIYDSGVELWGGAKSQKITIFT